MSRYRDENVDLGLGELRLAWDADYCQSVIGRAIRLNQSYEVAGGIEDFATTQVAPNTDGVVFDLWIPTASNMLHLPMQFYVLWRGQADRMYVDATCVTVLADVPDDLSDTDAVEKWLTAS